MAAGSLPPLRPMPVWLRRLLIALAVLAALAVAAIAVLVATFDANRYKGLLVDAVRERHQRTLTIAGPIGLSVFPRLELTLRDVTLSEHRSPERFLGLEEAALSVQLLPLLRERRLAVDRVAARGVELVYTRDAQGRRNIDDLLAGRPADGPKAQDPAAAQPLSFDVRGIELARLKATVKDAPAGLDGVFEVEHLSTGRLADGAESPVELKARARLAQPKADASVELAARLTLALPADAPARVTLRDTRLALRGEGYGIKQLDARLNGALAWDGWAASAETLTLVLSGERAGLALKDSGLALGKLAYDPGQRRLALDQLSVKLAGRQGPRSLGLTLEWPKLAITGDQLAGSALKADAQLKSPDQTLDVAIASQSPAGSFERIRVPGLRIDVIGRTGARLIKGQGRADLLLATAPFSAALSALDLKLDLADPALPPTRIALRGKAQASAQAASWALDGEANEQKLAVSGRADLDRPVPRIEADARFGTLDLTRFVKPADGAAPRTDAPAADTPLDLSGLKAVDGRFTLRAAMLVYPPYRVADATLDAALAGGQLKVGELSGRAWGGRFTAQASAQAAARPQDQRVAVRLDASEVDIAALLKDVAQFEKLEGKGRVTADLATQGGSVAALRKQLDGTAAIALRDGAVRGINLAKVLRQWKSAVTLNKDAVQASSAQEKTDFSEITASFKVADGVARNDDLMAKSPFLRVTGAGAIDIGAGRIDYLARATVTGTPEGQDGAELAQLKGVTVPVKLAGPFEAVSYNVQWGAVAGELLKKRATESILGSGGTGGLLDKLTGRKPAASAPEGAASAPKKKESTKERLKELFGR